MTDGGGGGGGGEGGSAGAGSHLTLGLCTGLHAFTHAYQTMLVPLFLLIVADLKLPGVKSVALVLTIYSLVYCILSYPAGILADRMNRKVLLGVGLIVNALAFLLMGWTQQYAALLLLSVVAGVAGTVFHPAANALVTAHFPRAPGMAIGLLGMGAGIGFFAGPQYAGWRADATDWHQPCIDLGIAGLVFGVLFLLVGREARRTRSGAPQDGTAGVASRDAVKVNGDGRPRTLAYATPPRLRAGAPVSEVRSASPRVPLGPDLRRRMLGVASLLWMRDFAGVATTTLAGIYLQKALGRSVRETGFILGAMMLIAVVINPVLVYLTPGRRRLPVLTAILIAAGVILASVPFWRATLVLPVLCVFQACHLGSYAVSEAAMLERVPAAVRGRVVGMFLTLAGTLASLAPWIMGAWTDAMGERATQQAAYAAPFATIGLMIALAALSVPFIASLGATPDEQVVEPLAEVTPASMEPMA